ncbi:hypothetical protein ACFW7K_29640, partial [Streptomyces sp. NPDC058735]
MEEIDFPPDVRTMLWILLGEMPLQARENLAWESRELYLALQKDLIDLRAGARETIQTVEEALPPEVAQPYIDSVRMLTDLPGGTDPIQTLLYQLDELANGQIDYSRKIQGSKWEIIAEIIMLLAELALLAALMAFTGGASVSQMFLARARSKLAILMIIDRLLRMTHLAPTLGGAIQEAIEALGVQLFQIGLNTGGRKPSGVDWKDVAAAAAQGGLTSGFMEIFDKLLKPLRNYFKDLLGDVFGKFNFDRNSLLFKGLTNGPPEVVTTFAVGGTAESVAEVIVNGAFYDKWEFKWETFVGSGTSNLFEAGAGLAIGAGAFSIYNSYFADGNRFTDLNDLPGPGSRLGEGDPGPSGSEAPEAGAFDGPYAKGPSTVQSGLFTPGPATPPPNTVSTDLPDGVGSGIDAPPLSPYTPPPTATPPSAPNTQSTGGSDALSGPVDLTLRAPGTTDGTNGFNGTNGLSGTSGAQVPYLPPPTPSPASSPDTTPLTSPMGSGRTSGPSSGVDADLTTPYPVPDLEPDLKSDPATGPGTSSDGPGAAIDLPQGLTAPKGSSTTPELGTAGGPNGADVGTADPEEVPGSQDGPRDAQDDATGQDLAGRGTAGRATGGQPDLEGDPHSRVGDAPPVTDAETGAVGPPAPVGASAGPTTTAPAGPSAPSAPQGAAGSANQSQQSSQSGPDDRDHAADLPDQGMDQDGREESSDGTERPLAPSSRGGAADEAVTTPGASTNTTAPDGVPVPATPPAELRTSSGIPQPDAPSAPAQPSRADLTGGPAPSGDAAADLTARATDVDTSTETDTVTSTGPMPEHAVPVADPVRPEQWRAGRHDAPAVPVRAGQADPALDPEAPDGVRETLVRAWVQRIQADDGRWISSVSLRLPVRTGEGFAPDELAAFQERMQTLLDTRLNNGLLLPRSGDQLHIDLTLTPAPAHSEAVELSRSPQPDDTDQVHWRLHSVDPAAAPEETAARQARDDAAVLHMLLNYAGVPDRGRAAEGVLRRLVLSVDGGTAGPGRRSDPAPAVPLRYLETIENAIGAHDAVLDHPLSARGTRPPSGVDDPARAPQMLAPDRPDRTDRDVPVAPATPVRTASSPASASPASASPASRSAADTDEGQPATAPSPSVAVPPADATSSVPEDSPGPGKGKGRSTGPGTGSLAVSVPFDGTTTFTDDTLDHTLGDDAPIDDAIAAELAVEEARREYGDALSAFDRAARTADTLTASVESGRGGTDDAARLQDAWQDVERTQWRLDEARDRLRDLGADAADDAAAASVVPRVRRTEDEQRRTAALVTADDLPADPPRLAPDDRLTPAALTAAGITLGEGPALQAALNGSVQVGESGISPVDHVRLLMTRPGPWTDALDAIAAHAARRTWSAAYEDFARAADRASGVPTGTDPAEAWQRAVSLVLPLELHPVLADSRHARGDFRDAVRRVAEHLAVHGADAVSGTELASRLRRELGLPPRLPGGSPAVPPGDALAAPRPNGTGETDRTGGTAGRGGMAGRGGIAGRSGSSPVVPLSDDAKLGVGRRFSAQMNDLRRPVVLAGAARGRVLFDNPRPIGPLEFESPADVARYADVIDEAVRRLRWPRKALRLSADGRTVSGKVRGAEIVVGSAPQVRTGPAIPTWADGFWVPSVTEALADAAYTLALATDDQQRDSRLFDLLWALSHAPDDDAPTPRGLEALRGDAYLAARPRGSAPGLTLQLYRLLDGLARDPEAVAAIGHTWLSLGAVPADVSRMNAELHLLVNALRPANPVVSDRVRWLVSQMAGMAKDVREQELAALSPRDRELLASHPALVDVLRRTLSVPDFVETAAHLMVQVPPGVEQPVSARREARRLIVLMMRDPDVTAKLLTNGGRVVVVPRSKAITSLDPFQGLVGRATQDGRARDTLRGVAVLHTAGVPEENLLGESTSVPGAGSYEDGFSVTIHEFAHVIHMAGLSKEQRRLIRDEFDKTKNEDGALWPDGLLHGMDGAGRRTEANYSSRDEYEFFAQLTNVYFRANAGKDAHTRLRRSNGGPDWVRRHFPALFPLMRQLYGDVPDGAGPVNPVAAVQEQNEVYAGSRALWDEAEGVHVPQPHTPAPVSAPPAPVSAPPAPAAARAADGITDAPAAPPAAPPAVPGELSEYVRTHGTLHDGHVGLVFHEPTPDPVLDGLHGQIIRALGVDPAGTEGQELRARLRDELGAVEIESNRPYLLSRQGHRITLRQGGRDRSVDVRLAYADAAKSAKYGRNTGQRPVTLPDVQTEVQAAGGQTSSHRESSGTVRTASTPSIGIFRNEGTGPLRLSDVTASVSATHNQVAQSVSVDETFEVTSKQQAEEPAHPTDVDGRWQVQVDTPRDDQTGNWQPEQSHGTLTIWVHEHLAFDGADSGDLPEPGDVDDLPLWGAASVAEPRRLLTELLQHQDFSALLSLDEDSEKALETFLSQRMLQGTPHLQRTGGVFSPTLLDEDGNAVGVLELTAVIEPGQPMRQSAEGASNLETLLSHSSSVERSAKWTSGLGVEIAGGPSLTADHTAGHPRALKSFGGNVMSKAGVNWQLNDQLNSVSSAKLTHGIRTTTGHLLTPARVTYTVTLHRAGGGQASGTFGPWEDGLRLRIARREVMTGHRPGPDDVRELPEHLEHLTGIGYTETPLKIEGADPLFARAEAWLRQEGFLPPAEPRRRWLPFRLDEPLVIAQLENLRRLRQMRSRFGLAASAADSVDGGQPAWFDRPHAVSGTRRVQLRFSVARDYARPSDHVRRLPDVLQGGSSSYEAGGGRQRGAALSGSAGGGAGFQAPLYDGAWGLNAASDYLATGQITDTGNTGDSVGYDQVAAATENGSELFEVPARLGLDLYEGPGDDPRIRFADGAGTDDGAGATDGTALLAPGATPHTVPGEVTLLVPHYRTQAPAASPVPAAPRPGHVIRELVTDGGPADDRRRLNLVDAQGRPLPGVTRLPEGAVVDTFRGTAALREALGQIVAGTYPGHPEQGPVGRAVRRASVQLSGLATETARRGSAVKEALPESLTGAVNRAASAVSWAAAPVTWTARTSADGVAATYKWMSVALAGASLNDQGTLATETRHDAIRPAQLMSRARQILDGAYLVEGLMLPGMAADRVMTLEISGYLTNPRNLGSESLYTEQDLLAGETAGRERGIGVTHQGNAQLSGLQSPPAPPGVLVRQANPAGRYSQSRRTDDISTVNSVAKATHTTHHTGSKLWIGSDLTLLLTVRWGVRNVAGNAVGLGTYTPVTVAVYLPRAVTYLASAQSVARMAAWLGGMQGLPGLTQPQPGVPLPGRFVRTRQLGKATVLAVTQLDDTTNRRERRDRLRQELIALVESEAPGVTRPGHASYVSGVATEIARTTEPAALRALPRRGPAGHVRFHFVHVAYGGARLVEVTLSAEPIMQTPALRGVHGRPADEGTGLELGDTLIAQGRATSSGVTTTRQAMVSVVSRYPRNGGVGLPDRSGPSATLAITRARIARSEVATEDRFWTRSGSAADFDLDYLFTASVRSQAVWQWPPNIPGAVFQDGLLNLSGLDGDVARRVRGWMGRLLRGRPVGRVSVPAATALRFIGSEAVEPRLLPAPRPPALLTVDPLLLSPGEAAARGTLPFPDGARLEPTGPTPLYDFNAAPQLAQALREVDPRMARSWQLPANASSEAMAVRLGEMIQAGEISLDPSGTAAGLTTTMPGSWPMETPDTPPSLRVALHRPRPVTDTGDVAVDRGRRQVRTSSTVSSTAGSFVLNQQGLYRVGPSNSLMLGQTFPLLAQQPHAMSSGGKVSASEFSRLRTGTVSESTDRRGTRSYETLVDLVITVDGPGGVRYVTGSSTTRLWERDVLGFGVTPPRPGPGIYDLPAMLVDLDADDLRDWARHPVTDLPRVLAGGIDEQDASAEMWLALGPDPDGTRLARALFVGSRTAALAGKPVELVVRTDQGLRYWPFDADGSLADVTDATHDAWAGVRDAIGTYVRAVRAEATARHREDVLARRRPGALRALEEAGRAVDTATAAHRTADLAHADAVRTAGTVRSELTGTRDRIGAAREEIARLDATARDAQTRYEAAADEELRLREQGQQARAEVDRLGRLVADAETTPAAASRNDLAAAEEYAEDVREREAAAVRQRQLDLAEMTTARAAADELRTTLDEDVVREAALAGDLARAEADVSRAESTERQADAELRRRTGARDAIRSQLGEIEGDLATVRQELAEHARRHSQAWEELPGLTSALESGRRAESIGAGPSLRGSGSSAPARPTRSGRFGGQPLPAPPPEEPGTAGAPVTAAVPAPVAAPRPDLPPAERADLTTRLPRMTEEERTSRLLSLSSPDREALASDRALAAALRQALPADAFARTAALLMVDVPAGVDLPVSSGIEARAQVARMLRSPAVAERMLTGGARMIVVPKDAALTSLDAFGFLRGESAQDARPFETVRGLQAGGRTAVGEENLLGDATAVPGAGPYADGYSAATHDFAHAVHRHGLTDEQRRLITEAFHDKVLAGGSAAWPDGPLYDASGTHRNYSSRNEYEFFAQLTNAYLGTNTGTDPYTGRPRNNGSSWVRRHEPTLLPLLRELYGTEPRGIHPWRANPRAQADVWAAFRAMWDPAENTYRAQPHAPGPAVAPEPASRPRSPLSLAQLEQMAARVAGGDAVGSMSVQRCLVLLRAMRDALYPRGVRPAIAVDDSVLGDPSAASSLVPGPGWHAVRSWDAVAAAVAAQGPSAVAFVLARRQGGVLGHAWAAYHLGGFDGVVWVDVSAGPGRQVSPRPPAVAASEARALVLDPSGQVVEHALPEFAQSSSTAHAVLDAATERGYGALGLEVEKRQWFTISGIGDLPPKQVLAHAPGLKIVTDHAPLWRTADGRVHLTTPTLAPGEPQPRLISYLIGEVVLEPMAVLPGEQRQSQDLALARLDRVERALETGDEPGSAQLTRLSDLLPAQDGWETTELGDKALVARSLIQTTAAYVQPTTGLPALGLSALQDAVVDLLPHDALRQLDMSGREFGMKATADFVRAFTGRSKVPDHVVPFLSPIPDIDELWGYLRLGYAHTVARPAGAVLNHDPSGFVVKNGLAVASRHALDRIRRALRPRTREYLDEHHDGINASLAVVLGRLLEAYRKNLIPDKPFFPGYFDATIGDVPSPREHMTSVLTGRTSRGKVVTQKQMVDMDDDQYPTLDTDDGRLEVPLVLTELRHFGYTGQLMTPEEIRRAVAELSKLSRDAYQRALTHRAPLPEDVLRDAVTRVLDNDVVRGLADFVFMVLLQGLPQPSSRSYRRLMSVGESQRITRALGEYALGTPLPDDGSVQRALRTAVDEASEAIDTVAPQHRSKLQDMVGRARTALEILDDPERTPPALVWASELVAVDGARVPLDRVLVVGHRDAEGRPVGTSSRPLEDWQEAGRHNYGLLPGVVGFTFVRPGPVPLESPALALPFAEAYLVGLRGGPAAAMLALSDGSHGVFDYARVVDFLFAVDGHLSALAPERPVLVVGADLAG